MSGQETPKKRDRRAEADHHRAMRRTVDALTALTGCRREQARERIREWLSEGKTFDDIDRLMRQPPVPLNNRAKHTSGGTR